MLITADRKPRWGRGWQEADGPAPDQHPAQFPHGFNLQTKNTLRGGLAGSLGVGDRPILQQGTGMASVLYQRGPEPLKLVTTLGKETYMDTWRTRRHWYSQTPVRAAIYGAPHGAEQEWECDTGPWGPQSHLTATSPGRSPSPGYVQALLPEHTIKCLIYLQLIPQDPTLMTFNVQNVAMKDNGVGAEAAQRPVQPQSRCSERD